MITPALGSASVPGGFTAAGAVPFAASALCRAWVRVKCETGSIGLFLRGRAPEDFSVPVFLGPSNMDSGRGCRTVK
jgi:hypothetical protein